MRNLYAKLGTHRRGETVARARALGLLAPRLLLKVNSASRISRSLATSSSGKSSTAA
jgi:hypothetical protein